MKLITETVKTPIAVEVTPRELAVALNGTSAEMEFRVGGYDACFHMLHDTIQYDKDRNIFIFTCPATGREDTFSLVEEQDTCK